MGLEVGPAVKGLKHTASSVRKKGEPVLFYLFKFDRPFRRERNEKIVQPVLIFRVVR